MSANIDVTPAMPTASVNTAATVKPLALVRLRQANRTSFINGSIVIRLMMLPDSWHRQPYLAQPAGPIQPSGVQPDVWRCRSVLRSPLVRGIVYVLYLALACVAMLEVLLRAGLPQTAPYEERQAIQQRLTGRPGVLVLGDSFSIEGDGSVGSLLRDYFAARGMDTVNLAKMGEGPSFYADRLRQYGGLVRPRLVLVNYFAGNDLTDTEYQLNPRGQAKWLVKRLMLRSFSANQVIGLVHNGFLRRRLSKIQNSRDYGRPGIEKLTNPFMFEIRDQHPDFLLENLNMTSAEAARAWEANKSVLLDIQRSTQALGAELVVHVFPPDVQVQASHFAFYRTLGIQIDPGFLVNDRPQRRFAEFCTANALTCYDVLPALRAARDRELYLQQDTHWNAEGNRIAFEEMRRNLESATGRTTLASVVSGR